MGIPIIPAILTSGIGTALIGILLWFSIKTDPDEDISKRDGYLIVTLGWVASSLVGTLPYMIYGSIPSFSDAFFETMSGFTTTGATILKDIEVVPPGFTLLAQYDSLAWRNGNYRSSFRSCLQDLHKAHRINLSTQVA